MAMRARILGELLVQSEGVDRAVLEDALGPARAGRERVGETLVRLGAITPDAVARALATQLGVEHVEAPVEAEPEALEAVEPELLRAHRMVPISVTARRLRIAMADPLNLAAVADVQFQTGRRVEPVVATAQAVDEALERYYGAGTSAGEADEQAAIAANERRAGAGAKRAGRDGSGGRVRGRRGEGGRAGGAAGVDLLSRNGSGDLSELVLALPDELREGSGTRIEFGERDEELERATRDAPVVRLVDRILRDAIENCASDIHVEETGGDVRVRLRIDGRLRQTVDLPAAARRAILSRIKVIAGMDIAVRRRAQDGRLALTHRGRRLTLRVSTLPVNGGEKAVVRILDGESAPRDLGELGMSASDLTQLRRMLERGEGVLLAAGPTGSGKSTTLFAALSELDRDTANVVTLEDPVEYRLRGASQVQVDRRAGLGFADALRAVLRQDPDVVMIGEIRDRETAEIAMAAAVTGHLVLSTIHTTDAPGAVTRLLHMGVPPFLVAGGLAGVVAQRLVPRCCPSCRGRGCASCDRGARGRTGVYQVLTVSDAMRDEISAGGSAARLRRLAAETGMRSLASDARRAVAAGLTTPHEVARFLVADSAGSLPCDECGTGVPFGALGCPGCGHLRGVRCACGQPVEKRWRYCPWCIRPVTA
jgi:type IV pilus assembly protein PilB